MTMTAEAKFESRVIRNPLVFPLRSAYAALGMAEERVSQRETRPPVA